jgi:toxin YoeB
MRISFQQDAFDNFADWSIVNKDTYKKIITLIKEIKRTPFEGTGKPEALKHQLSGYWSRRINFEYRLVYKVLENEIIIISRKGHY